MMEKTALGSESNCAAHPWPNQATGAPLPNGSFRSKSEEQIFIPSTSSHVITATAVSQKIARAQHLRVKRILAQDPADNQYP
jgi:hypothetical protein